MEHQAEDSGRLQRKSISSLEYFRTGKSFTKAEGKEKEPSRSHTEPQHKREQIKHQGKEGWHRKKQLSQDVLKPCSTKPPGCTHRGRRLGAVILAPVLESIYQPQPQRVFSAHEAQHAMKTVLERKLKDSSYDGPGCSKLTLDVAEAVKQAVRALGYERYKLVCYVVLGPVARTGLCCSSRSIWSPASDTYAEYIFKNSLIFALCVVYAGYYE